MIDEGLDKAKRRRVEILPTDGVVWCVVPESATQSWTEVGGWVERHGAEGVGQ
jgi:hypothetical protein